MIIETLADEKSKIYFISGGKICTGIVSKITIYIEKRAPIINYLVENSSIQYNESDIGLTQEGLFDKIRIKEKL